MLERIHDIETRQRVDSGRIDNLEDNSNYAWRDIEKLKDMVGAIRVEVAKIMVFATVAQAAITAGIVYFLTKGIH